MVSHGRWQPMVFTSQRKYGNSSINDDAGCSTRQTTQRTNPSSRSKHNLHVILGCPRVGPNRSRTIKTSVSQLLPWITFSGPNSVKDLVGVFDVLTLTPHRAMSGALRCPQVYEHKRPTRWTCSDHCAFTLLQNDLDAAKESIPW